MDNKSYEEYVDRSQQILMQLMSVNTCQPQGNEKKLVSFLIKLLPSGTEYHEIVHTPERSSLVVRVPGRIHTDALAFAGHIDTVSYGARENWDYEPGCPTVVGDRIYGRGSSDMKGGVAAMTATLLYLVEQKIDLEHDVYFCYTADEEKSGLGAQALNVYPSMAQVSKLIIAEPTNGQISIGEKGALWLRAEACGVQCHGSRPDLGINAIEMLFELHRRICRRLDTDSVHPMLGHSTMSVTDFTGGVSTNIVPAKASMELDIRLIPGQSNQDMVQTIQNEAQALCKEHKPLHIGVEILNSRPAIAVDCEAPFVCAMQEVARSLGMNDALRGTIFYTDASQIVPTHKMPFLILGPGDDKLAHQGNEFITVTSLREVTELYINYILHCML